MSGAERTATVPRTQHPCPRCNAPVSGHGRAETRRALRRHLHHDHGLPPRQARVDAYAQLPHGNELTWWAS